MSIWEKCLYAFALGFLFTAMELFLLQTVVWWFDLTLPSWMRLFISESKWYVMLGNIILCYLLMYKPWRFDNEIDDELEGVKVIYQGAVLSPEYASSDLMRANSYDKVHSHHLLVPHGYGKITYLLEDEILEEYEGEFDTGEYHGHGKILFKGRQHAGKFVHGVLQK